MNKSDIKEMFREECEVLEDEKEIGEESIKFFEEEYERIEKFLNILNKLNGSSIIEKIDKNELYALRKYYLNILSNISVKLNMEKEIFDETNQLLHKILNISTYLHSEMD